MTATIALQSVSHRFGAFEALTNIDLQIQAGRFAVLLGPSGCGKTTLLSILGGFITPTQGRVVIGGVDVTHVTPARRPTTTMFQDYALFPHMSLGANVAFGLRMRGVARKARDTRAGEMLELVGLADAFNKRPHQISGGQRQRVALARALAIEPDVLLLDEPLGALDLKLRRQMQDELKSIQRRLQTTFVHVTHDQEEALAIADDIIIMNGGEVADVGTPESVYLRPENVFSAAFMGEANFFNATLGNLSASEQTVQVSCALGAVVLEGRALIERGFATGDEVTLCFRPEHVTLLSTSDSAIDFGPVSLDSHAFSGTHRRCRLLPQRSPEQLIVAYLPQHMSMADVAGARFGVAVEHLNVLPRKR